MGLDVLAHFWKVVLRELDVSVLAEYNSDCRLKASFFFLVFFRHAKIQYGFCSGATMRLGLSNAR